MHDVDDLDSDVENSVEEFEESSLPPESERASWLDDASQEIEDIPVEDFEIISSPNDWNFATIVNFIESGALKIPAFQRNYVWDKKRASKLIESLLIGLPVPQVFLYEEGRNRFLVIDGQQRLLSLYFYAKGRFPHPKVRGEIRPFLGEGLLNDDLINDDSYFEPFKLLLPRTPTGRPNRFNGLSYHGLKEDRINLDLRTLRNIVVKETGTEPSAAVYEIFSRLNAGGVNLSPQEIRASLYHSQLINGLLDLNLDKEWRALVGQNSPDTRMRDTEFLLRSLALARDLDIFSGSMALFINSFCIKAQGFTPQQTEEAVSDLRAFIHVFNERGPDIFARGTGNKFSGVLFESFFAAWIRLGKPALSPNDVTSAIEQTKISEGFTKTLQEGSTKSVNIKGRVSLAEQALRSARAS